MANLSTSVLDYTFLVLVHNESPSIYSTMNLLNSLDLDVSYEIVIIDDGSLDNPFFNNIDRDFELYRHINKMGYGYSLREGILKSRGRRIITFTPSDIMSIKEINLLMKKSDEVDLLLGSKKQEYNMPFYMSLLRDVGSTTIYLTKSIKISDPYSSIKSINKQAFLNLNIIGKSLDIHLEMIRKFIDSNYLVKEIILNNLSEDV